MAYTLTPTEEENRRILTGQGGTRDLQLQSGNPAAILRQGQDQAQGVAGSTPSSRFAVALQGLMQRYQQMGTRPAVEQGLNAQSLQTGRIAVETPPELIGAAPGLQAGVRSAAAGAVQPTISGASQAQQTFKEQLSGFGSALEAAQAFATKQEQSDRQKQEDARAVIEFALKGGASGLEALVQAQPDIFKNAGMDAKTVQSLLPSLKEKESKEAKKSVQFVDLGNRYGVFDMSGNLLRYEQKGQAPGTAGSGAGNLKLTAAQEGDIADMNTLIDQLSTLGSSNLEGAVGAIKGPFASAKLKFLGKGSEVDAGTRALIGNIKGTVAKLRGGTSFTPNEQALLESYVPSINESQASVRAKAKALQDFITTKKNNLLSVAGGNVSSTTQKIRVKLKSSGQTGTIPADEFDPKIYTKI